MPLIPRLVHQIWVRAGDGYPLPPPRLAGAAASWRALEPRWTYRLWDDDQLEDLFARRRPDLLPLYRSYPYAVQRADAGRYLIMHEFGGTYADLDVACATAPDDLLGHPLVLAPTEPLGISIDFMMARPEHPLFRSALDGLDRARARWHRPWIPRHFRVMAGTGSLYLTGALKASPDADDVRLLTRGEYGHGDAAQALVRHLPGNTWAGWDTHAFVFLSNHWRALLAAGVAAVAAVVVLLR